MGASYASTTSRMASATLCTTRMTAWEMTRRSEGVRSFFVSRRGTNFFLLVFAAVVVGARDVAARRVSHHVVARGELGERLGARAVGGIVANDEEVLGPARGVRGGVSCELGPRQRRLGTFDVSWLASFERRARTDAGQEEARDRILVRDDREELPRLPGRPLLPLRLPRHALRAPRTVCVTTPFGR